MILWKFPHSDFNEVNLDWIIEQIRLLKARIDEVEERVNAFEERINALETWRTDVETWREQVNEEITSILADIETINEDIESLTERVAALEGRMSDAEEDIDILTEAVGNIREVLTEIQSNISALQGTAQRLQELIAGLDNRLEAAEIGLSNLTTRTGNIETAVRNLASDIETLNANVTELDNSLATLRTRVSAVETALNGKMGYVDNGVVGAKNLLVFDVDNIKSINTFGEWNDNVYTYNGISYSLNDDGSVDVTGTSYYRSFMYYTFDIENPYAYPDVLLNGFIGGVDVNYQNCLYAASAENDLYFSTSANGVNIPSNIEIAAVVINVGNGRTENTTFYPMLRLATDTDPTYQPYAMTNQELTRNVRELQEQIAGIAPSTQYKTQEELFAAFNAGTCADGVYQVQNTYSHITNISHYLITSNNSYAIGYYWSNTNTEQYAKVLTVNGEVALSNYNVDNTANYAFNRAAIDVNSGWSDVVVADIAVTINDNIIFTSPVHLKCNLQNINITCGTHHFSFVSNSIIENLLLSNATSDCIVLNGDNILIKNVVCNNLGRFLTLNRCTNVIVENCNIDCTTGIYTQGTVTHLKVHNCIFTTTQFLYTAGGTNLTYVIVANSRLDSVNYSFIFNAGTTANVSINSCSIRSGRMVLCPANSTASQTIKSFIISECNISCEMLVELQSPLVIDGLIIENNSIANFKYFVFSEVNADSVNNIISFNNNTIRTFSSSYVGTLLYYPNYTGMYVTLKGNHSVVSASATEVAYSVGNLEELTIESNNIMGNPPLMQGNGNAHTVYEQVATSSNSLNYTFNELDIVEKIKEIVVLFLVNPSAEGQSRNFVRLTIDGKNINPNAGLFLVEGTVFPTSTINRYVSGIYFMLQNSTLHMLSGSTTRNTFGSASGTTMSDGTLQPYKVSFVY